METGYFRFSLSCSVLLSIYYSVWCAICLSPSGGSMPSLQEWQAMGYRVNDISSCDSCYSVKYSGLEGQNRNCRSLNNKEVVWSVCVLLCITVGNGQEMRPPAEGEEESSNSHAAQSSIEPRQTRVQRMMTHRQGKTCSARPSSRERVGEWERERERVKHLLGSHRQKRQQRTLTFLEFVILKWTTWWC